jgi:hypothetical protein
MPQLEIKSKPVAVQIMNIKPIVGRGIAPLINLILDGREGTSSRTGRCISGGRSPYPLKSTMSGLKKLSGSLSRRDFFVTLSKIDPRTFQPIAYTLYQLNYKS